MTILLSTPSGTQVQTCHHAQKSRRCSVHTNAFPISTFKRGPNTIPHQPHSNLSTTPSAPQPLPAQPSPPSPHHSSTKLLLLTSAAALMLAAAAPSPASARLELPNKEVDDATSPLVQKLLQRTQENRERYAKERLQDYYRRNFKEYFEFEASSAKVARARGLSSESAEAIAKWLQENK